MKYRIIVDYGTYEGMKFWNDKEYETVDEAVKTAIQCHSQPFLIVNVVNWKAFPANPTSID